VTAFVDTGYYVATIVKNDQWNRKARRVRLRDAWLVTSSLVISETVAFLQAKGYTSAAIDFLQQARANERVQVIQVDAALQSEAWDLFYRWAGSGASPVDCASFAIMARMGIRQALTFDQHFAAAGFRTLR